MGTIAILFGIACAVVFMTAALCRSMDAVMGSVVLGATWLFTKVWKMPYGSGGGICLDAACTLLVALLALLLMYKRGSLFWPRLMVSAMLVKALVITAWAMAHNMGFEPASYPYALSLNVLYGIALFSVLSLGLHDGAVHIRAWLSLDHHVRPWSSPGAKWGREAEDLPWKTRR